MSTMTSASNAGRGEDMHDALDALFEVSQILNTGLDRESLLLCVKLCNNGVNPEALAGVVKYLREESARVSKVASGARS